MDRVYDDSRKIQQLFRDYAIKKGYYYRIKVHKLGFNGEEFEKNIKVKIPNYKLLSVVPYMDTFIYGYKGIISNTYLHRDQYTFDETSGVDIN